VISINGAHMTLTPQNPGPRKHTKNAPEARSGVHGRGQEDLTNAHFSQRGFTQAEADAYVAALPKVRQERELKEKLELSLNAIGLPEKTSEALFRRGIFTVEDLLNCHESELRALLRFDDGTIKGIFKCISRLGFERGSS
jgi:hypothetical protein